MPVTPVDVINFDIGKLFQKLPFCIRQGKFHLKLVFNQTFVDEIFRGTQEPPFFDFSCCCYGVFVDIYLDFLVPFRSIEFEVDFLQDGDTVVTLAVLFPTLSKYSDLTIVDYPEENKIMFMWTKPIKVFSLQPAVNDGPVFTQQILILPPKSPQIQFLGYPGGMNF